MLGGASDYLIGTLSVGGKGAITGMANITPRVLVKVYDLFQAGARDQALELAGLVSRSEWAIGKGGILGTKVSHASVEGAGPLQVLASCMRTEPWPQLTTSTPFSGRTRTPHPPLPVASLYPLSPRRCEHQWSRSCRKLSPWSDSWSGRRGIPRLNRSRMECRE